MLDGLDADRFPLKEMVKRAWIPDVPDLKGRASELVAGFLGRAGGPDAFSAVPMYRKNDHQRINAKTDPYALRAWCWQVLASANDDPPSVPYERTVSPDFLRDVARLSLSEDGPVQARDFLRRSRDRPAGGAPTPEDAPGRRRLRAAGEATRHRAHPAPRPHRQLLVLPPARAGPPRPPH